MEEVYHYKYFITSQEKPTAEISVTNRDIMGERITYNSFIFESN